MNLGQLSVVVAGALTGLAVGLFEHKHQNYWITNGQFLGLLALCCVVSTLRLGSLAKQMETIKT